MKKGKKPYYTKEFKEEAVKLVVEQGYRISEAAKSLGVSDSAIRKWKLQLGPKSNKVDQDQQAEIKQLKNEGDQKWLLCMDKPRRVPPFPRKQTNGRCS